MLLAGYGKLVQMIIALNKEQKNFYIFNRTAEKVQKDAMKDKRLQYTSSHRFHTFTTVFLALPPEACFSFLKQFESLFPDDTVIFHTSTNLKADDLKKTAPRHYIIPAKFAGHAKQAVREKRGGTFVVPGEFKNESASLDRWLGDAFTVVNGTEDMVKKANKKAVEETIKLAIELAERLEKEGVSKPIREAVISQIPAGVLHAHLEGRHGAFARQVLDKMEGLKGDESK
ncbi:hypothetical protein ACE1TI_04415 [Alteribacillus sp. JSM 102045]|uniref:hypothetical protein n=1 Tax=Alteribacillus sp. JSM 102045 TaxID=1562101 RepID=UPI0035C2150E